MPKSRIRGTFLKRKPTCGLTLAEMYSVPYIYGAAPGSVKWASDNETFAFLWNEEGGMRRDIYVSRPGEPLFRLTDSAAIAALPVEDDERPREEVEYAELMYRGVSDFAWAPDGTWIAFVCRGNLFRIPARGGQPERLVQSAQGVGQLQVAPDAALIGFTIGANVWAYDVETGAVRQVTFFQKDQVSVDRYQWSPDGRWLGVIVVDRSMYEVVKMPDYTPEKGVKINEFRRNNVGKPRAKTRVGIVPSSGGKLLRAPLPEPLTEGGGLEVKAGELDTGNGIFVHRCSWTWDSAHFVVGYVSKEFKDYRLYAIPAEAPDKPVLLYSEEQKPWFCWSAVPSSPDSKYVYFESYKTGWKHLYRVPIIGGEAEQLTAGEFDVGNHIVPRYGDRLYYTAWAPSPVEEHVFSLPLNGGRPVDVSPEGYASNEVSVSPNGTGLAFTSSNVMLPPEVFRRTRRGESIRLTTSPRPEFTRLPTMKVKRFTFTNESDGATVHARMLLPQDFDASKKYPVVLTCVYAGGAKEGFGRYQILDTYMANEMGYMLVAIDFRASMGHGSAFFYGYHKKMGLIDSDEAASCAKYMRTLPYVDPERIGLWGGSYGGFLTLMAMAKHPGLFHTGISWKPVTDWRNYDDGYTGERLGRPQDDPDTYRATSPVFHADKLEGNLLLVHGMQDDNVLFQDAVWMVQKLVEAGKYFDLMVYPRDDHMMSLRHESLPDLMERFAAYFEEQMGLGPVE
ncbi:MAG: S9 family peptidase [Verrucomicrobia bacterium]|nr:S9 family peptidase [Verrucomicrobiota bacterium]